jgi:ParB/RepB/Spo0J family partition protein
MSNNNQKRKRAPRKDVFFIDVEQMIPSYVTNIRTDYGDLSDLVAAITENPDRIPALRGHKDSTGYIITDGHRRMAAGLIVAQNTGKTVLLPYYSEPRDYTDADRLSDMFLLNQGKELTMMEQAVGIQKYTDDFGLTPKEIAQKLHKSVTYVSNCLQLIKADDFTKKQISDEIIAPSLVLSLMKNQPIQEVSKIIKDTLENITTKMPASTQTRMTLSQAFVSPEDNDSPDSHPIELLDKDNEGDEPTIIKSEETFNNSNDGAVISGLKPRITKKDIDNTLEKYNSLQAFKTMLKKYPDTVFNPRAERSEELVFFQNVIEGNLSVHTIWDRYFQVSSDAELKEQLKS